MGRRRKRPYRWIAVLFAVLGMCSMSFVAGAVPTDLVWTGSRGDIWTDSDSNWISGSSDAPIPFVNGDNVTFLEGGDVTIRGLGVSTGNFTVKRNADYLFTGGALRIGGNLTVEDNAGIAFENDSVSIGSGKQIRLGQDAVIALGGDTAVYSYGTVSAAGPVLCRGDGAWIDCLPYGGFFAGDGYYTGIAFTVRNQQGELIPAENNPRIVIQDADTALWSRHREKEYDPAAVQDQKWYAVQAEELTIVVTAEGYDTRTMSIQPGPGVTFDLALTEAPRI